MKRSTPGSHQKKFDLNRSTLHLPSNTMILNFLNPSTFAHETADIKLAYFQSAVSWANVAGFKKFKIMVLC